MKQQYIRNFAIIAHVDHGKSTLSDRLLEITGTVRKEVIGDQEQFLDMNPISRKRGITIKLAPVRMKYRYHAREYILNLIDTPGHVDFSYEVSRTLAACEGVVLLVDATHGIQAQTVAHFRAAKKERLKMIPVINKIDLPNAQPEKVSKELEDMFGFQKDEILLISAKTGIGVEDILTAVIEKIPSPSGNPDGPLRALIFDAVYDEHKGVVAYVRIADGKVSRNDHIQLFQSNQRTNAIEVGYFSPFPIQSAQVGEGEIGYIVTGIKDIHKCRVGDTIIMQNTLIQPLPGYVTPKPMVFFGVYPPTTDEFILLRESLHKFALADASITFQEEYSPFLGSGFRVGFLGLLHAEIFRERMKQEFHLDPFLTMPHVLYEKKTDGTYEEPFIHMTIYSPTDYVGNIMTVAQKKHGNLTNLEYQESNVIMEYDMPYSMFIRGFSADVKTVSSGFGSIDYELIDYRPADIVNLAVHINDVEIDVLSEFVYRDEAQFIAREKAEKIKEFLPRQQYRQIIQIVVDSRILAREEISPYRKDVLSKMSGGDRTRKDKLLEKQKKGKKKMFSISKIDIPADAIINLIKNA